MRVSAENFKYIQEFARDTAAIILETGKEYLVESRLTPIARQAGFATLNAFLHQLRTDRTATLFHEKIIDALTTNETSFFRDFQPFECLRQHLLPRLLEQRAGTRKLSVWSAACSTGQEPYTVAMLLRENFPQLIDWEISILATDLSPTVLAQARQGSYSQLEVNRGLPAPFLAKYFTKTDDRWKLHDEIRNLVEFRQMNLVKPWPILPAFDIILARNVMIYFDTETKRSILKRIRQCLQSQGTLLLGAAETTLNLDPEWEPTTIGKSTVYHPRPTLAAAA